MHVTHKAAEQAFTVRLDGHDAELTYARPTASVIDFQHTWVDEALRGRGVADALALAALTYAKNEHLRIRTTCAFMKKYVARHTEWAALREEAPSS